MAFLDIDKLITEAEDAPDVIPSSDGLLAKLQAGYHLSYDMRMGTGAMMSPGIDNPQFVVAKEIIDRLMQNGTLVQVGSQDVGGGQSIFNFKLKEDTLADVPVIGESAKTHHRQMLAKHRALPIDAKEYPAIPGMEGPFRMKDALNFPNGKRSGEVVYWDPKEGKYYDRKADMYTESIKLDEAVRWNEIKGSDGKMFGATAKVAFARASGTYGYADVAFRVHHKDLGLSSSSAKGPWLVDKKTMSSMPWESISSKGFKTQKAATAFIAKWIKAANKQEDLDPKVESVQSFSNLVEHIDFILTEEASEGGFKLNVATLPLAKARAYAEKEFKKSGKSLDEVIPDFDANYKLLQKKCKKAKNVPRIDMPVIEPKDMKEFQKKLTAGYIDIFKPYAKGKLTMPRDFKPGEGEVWVSLGTKDGKKDDDTVKAKWGKTAAKKLLPTQSQIWLEKLIANIIKFGVPSASSPIAKATVIVSKEGYILDGHHRFGQALLANPGMSLSSLSIPLDIATLLKVGVSYGSAIGNKPKG